MKRKKQLLSWILSFLMVFSIMPMISISAFAETTYGVNDNIKGNKLYPGDVIQDLNNNGIEINYYKNPTDAYNGTISKFIATEAGEDATILSLDEAPSGYVLDGYIVEDIIGSSDVTRNYRLIAQWQEGKKITYEMDHITVLNEKIKVDGESSVADGNTYVATGAAVTITIEADTGYKLPDTIAVEMGGSAIENPNYEYNKAIGEIRVHNITGDVKITAVGIVKSVEPQSAVSVVEITDIGRTSATLRSSIILGNETIINQGFEWKKADGGTYTRKTGTLNNGILTASLTGLAKNTRYNIRPFVVTGTNTYYGAEKTFRTKNNTSSGNSSNNSSGSASNSKSDILIAEPTGEAMLKELKNSDYKKVQVNIDSNPNLLLSKAIIDDLTENKDKTLTVVSNNVSTNISINENNEMQFTRNGSILTGFVSVFNSTYYSNYNGIVQKGWVSFPGDNWYYFDKETGIRGQGWIDDNGSWYYLNQLGLMETGWINDSGVWYYLDKSGRMLDNTIIDGYVLGSSGAWIG